MSALDAALGTRYAAAEDGGLTEEEERIYDALQEARALDAEGQGNSYIFAKTGWFKRGGDHWSYGFENRLPNGESADIILEKERERNGKRRRWELWTRNG